jgi:hypothetical protein
MINIKCMDVVIKFWNDVGLGHLTKDLINVKEK